MAEELERKIATKSFVLHYANTKRTAIIQGDIVYCMKVGNEKMQMYNAKGRYLGSAYNPPIGDVPPSVRGPIE